MEGETRDNWDVTSPGSVVLPASASVLPAHPQPVVSARDSFARVLSVPSATEGLTLASVHFASSFLSLSCILLLPKLLLYLLL